MVAYACSPSSSEGIFWAKALKPLAPSFLQSNTPVSSAKVSGFQCPGPSLKDKWKKEQGAKQQNMLVSDMGLSFYIVLGQEHLVFDHGEVAHACKSQHSGRPRQADHKRPVVQDQPGQHGKTLSLLKKLQKH
ncbi:hypothetical protein AAY473_022507 [Plecturocebus cupreus]